MTQLLLAFAGADLFPSCPVIGRGECDCKYCREAWPDEYDQPQGPPKGDGIVRGKRPAGWVVREWTVGEIEAMEGGSNVFDVEQIEH